MFSPKNVKCAHPNPEKCIVRQTHISLSLRNSFQSVVSFCFATQTLFYGMTRGFVVVSVWPMFAFPVRVNAMPARQAVCSVRVRAYWYSLEFVLASCSAHKKAKRVKQGQPASSRRVCLGHIAFRLPAGWHGIVRVTRSNAVLSRSMKNCHSVCVCARPFVSMVRAYESPADGFSVCMAARGKCEDTSRAFGSSCRCFGESC